MHSHNQHSTEFMSIAQVENELGISRSTVYNMLHAGKLKSVKLGKYRRVTRSSFNDYLEELYAQIEPQA